MRKVTKVRTKFDHEEIKKRLFRFYNRLENHLSSLKTTHRLVRCTNTDEICRHTKGGRYCVDKIALQMESWGGVMQEFEGSFDKSSYSYCGVDWVLLEKDIKIYVGQSYGHFDEGFELPEALQQEIDIEKNHLEEAALFALAQDKLAVYQRENEQPKVMGKWRMDPYPRRVYNPLTEYIISDSIPPAEAKLVKEQLFSSLCEGFQGPALECDDMTQMEQWMRRFKDKGGKQIADEDTVDRILVEYTLDHMVSMVQHRLYNEDGVVSHDPVDLGPQLKEALVWGIDSYTRRIIELVLEDTCAGNYPPAAVGAEHSPAVLAAQQFIEKALLPCMNIQAPHEAHDMEFSLKEITKVIFVVYKEVICTFNTLYVRTEQSYTQCRAS